MCAGRLELVTTASLPVSRNRSWEQRDSVLQNQASEHPRVGWTKYERLCSAKQGKNEDTQNAVDPHGSFTGRSEPSNGHSHVRATKKRERKAIFYQKKKGKRKNTPAQQWRVILTERAPNDSLNLNHHDRDGSFLQSNNGPWEGALSRD